MREYRHAVIGCGRVAANHVDGFGAVPGWSVAVACDRQAHVDTFAKAHGIPAWTREHADVLTDPSVTSVSVTVDHAQHGELVRQALEAGKHVLVEKPLCLDQSQADALTALAAERGLVLSVVAQHRYDPLVLAVRAWVREGLLGDLLYVSAGLQARRTEDYYADSYWRGTRAGEGGSALINQGYHCLDTVRWICGDLTVHAAVAGTRVLTGVMETEDTLGALMSSGQVPVTLNVTVASSVDWRTRIELVGSLGSVVFDLDHPGTLHHCSGSDDLMRRAEQERARALAEEPPGISYYGVSHRRQIADFCQGIAAGTPMLSSSEDAVGTLRTIAALYDRAGAR